MSVELNLCAACAAFVNREWANCHVCGTSLSSETIVSNVAPMQVSATKADAQEFEPETDEAQAVETATTEVEPDESRAVNSQSVEQTDEEQSFDERFAEPHLEDEWSQEPLVAQNCETTFETVELAGRLTFPSFQSTFDTSSLIADDSPAVEGPAESDHATEADFVEEFGHGPNFTSFTFFDADDPNEVPFELQPRDNSGLDIENNLDDKQTLESRVSQLDDTEAVEEVAAQQAHESVDLQSAAREQVDEPVNESADESVDESEFATDFDANFAAITSPGVPDFSSIESMVIAPPEKKKRRELPKLSISGDAARTGGKLAGGLVGVAALVGVLALGATSMFKNEKPPAIVTPTTEDTSAMFKDWHDFTEPDGFYIASLPGTPVVKRDPQWSLAHADVPGTQNYVETYVRRLPANRNKTLDPDLMNQQLAATASERRSVVKSRNAEVVDSIRYLNGHFASTDGTINGDIRLFVKGDVLYGAWLVSPNLTGNPAMYAQLNDHFRPQK